jgi:hypothetical protein
VTGTQKLCHFSRQSRIVLERLSEPFGRLLSEAPILAIDESGNLGITGCPLTEDALANSATRSSESAEYRATLK